LSVSPISTSDIPAIRVSPPSNLAPLRPARSIPLLSQAQDLSPRVSNDFGYSPEQQQQEQYDMGFGQFDDPLAAYMPEPTASNPFLDPSQPWLSDILTDILVNPDPWNFC
jgi:hypothetical protein